MTDTVFQLKCSESQKMAWRAAAGRVTLSRWVRDILNREAGIDSAEGFRELRGPVLAERLKKEISKEKPVPDWAVTL